MHSKTVNEIFSLLIIVLTTVSIAYSGEPVLSKTEKVESSPITIKVGYVSEYWIRGSFQAASVSHASIAYASGPIYLSAGYADLRDRKGGATYNEGEAFVHIDRDRCRNRHALFKLTGRGIERLAELGDVHAVLTQGRPDRWGRGRLPRRNLQLYNSPNLFCHTT